MSSPYPKCFLKEMLGDSITCLPALLLLSLLTLVPSRWMKFSKATCVSTTIPRKGCWVERVVLLPSSWPGVFSHLDCLGFWGANPSCQMVLQKGLPHGSALRRSIQQTSGRRGIPALVQYCVLLQSLPFSAFFFFNSVLTLSLAVMDFVQLKR